MLEEDAKQTAEKDKCLVSVKNVVSEKKFNEILQVIEESEYTYDFKLTNKPLGKFQDDGYECLKGIYVDQTCNGGYTGDTFGGTVSVEYIKGKFLQFSYSM